MRENWQIFLDVATFRAKAHRVAANMFDTMHQVFSLINILLNAVVAAISLTSLPTLYVTIISSFATVFATVMSFLKPSETSQTHASAAKQFNFLLLSMVRCETEEDYEKLWRDMNDSLLEEPQISLTKKRPVNFEWTMTPELLIVVHEKEEQTKHIEKQIKAGKLASTSKPSDTAKEDKPIKVISK